MDNHQHTSTDSQNIFTALALNAFFVVVEVAGGLWTNSIAILSDALHDFGDCLSLGAAWLLQRKAAQGRDTHYSYGYKRFSLLGAVFLSGVLTVSSVVVIYEASLRIMHPQPVLAGGVLILAVIGIAINGLAALRLTRGHSLNGRAVFLHMMEDVLGWAAMLVAGLVMQFTGWAVIDPILSICISVWVLWNVYRNLRETFRVFLQAVPESVDLAGLQRELRALEGVQDLHDLHLWTLDGESHVMTLHVVTAPSADMGEHLREQINDLARRYHIDHVTTELELPDGCAGDNCDLMHSAQ